MAIFSPKDSYKMFAYKFNIEFSRVFTNLKINNIYIKNPFIKFFCFSK